MPQPLQSIARCLPLLALLVAAPHGGSRAEDPPRPGGMPTGAAAAPHDAADRAMSAGMGRMSQRMADVPLTGDPDRDFVAMMTPHHAGAIDMARTELKYGRDPELRRLARDIVAAQQREIAQMNAWIAAHPAG